MGTNDSFVGRRSSGVALAAALLLSGAAQAGTVNWVGGTGNWQDAWNWSGSARPGAADDVSLTWPYTYGATVYLRSGYAAQYGPARIASLRIDTSNRVEIGAETLQVDGNITNEGQLVLARSYGALSTLKIGADAALTGRGTLTLNNGSILDLNGHALTVGTGQTVRGAGDIGGGTLINQGRLMAEGVLSFYPGASQVDNRTGQITVGAQGVLGAYQSTITGGTITTAAGGLIAGAGSNPGATFSQVTFEGDARLIGAMTLLDVANKGTLRVNSFDGPGVKGAFTNDGNVYVSKLLEVQGDTRLTGGGTVWLSRELMMVDGSIGTLVLAPDSTLTIESTATVRGTGRIRGSAGSRIVNQGLVIAESGNWLRLITGDGTFDNQAGRLRVAHDGAMASDGTLVLGDASMLSFDVGSNATDHGQLNLMSSSAQALDGTLQLNIGYDAQVGDSFTLLTFAGGGQTGTFDQIVAAGYNVSATYTATDVTVTITGISAVPEPASWLLASAGLLALRWRARPSRRATCS